MIHIILVKYKYNFLNWKNTIIYPEATLVQKVLHILAPLPVKDFVQLHLQSNIIQEQLAVETTTI